jgi:hypothetical protein
MRVRLPHPTQCRKRRERIPALLLLTLAASAFALAPSPARAQGAGADSVVLRWTAPGDDGNVGTASRYEMRMSNNPISEANWAGASLVSGAPTPRPAGTRQSMVVRGLTQGVTYYFAIKAIDDAGNQAPLSNVVRWDWILDTAPPSAPSGVTAVVENGGKAVLVRWSPNGEPDLAGYTVYRRIGSSGSFTPLTAQPVTATQYLDSSIPGTATEVSYLVTASDVSGNESAHSATASASLEVASAADWSISAAYPNPSPGSGPVTIPVTVPASAGKAELQILDAGGHIIRRLPVAALGGGPQNLIWDGRNEAGLLVAPGVYTAWLVGGGSAHSLKLVRVP